MTILTYDASFHGFLTAVFEVYEYRLADVSIKPQHSQKQLFGVTRPVETDDVKAARVWKGLLKHIPAAAAKDIYNTFLSEQDNMEDIVLHYIRGIMSAGDISKNFARPEVLFIAETSRKVHREKHRMEAFVRFRQTADDLYYATVEPDFNVLPLISTHFEKRYADQLWLIYDLRRNYGIYYDLHNVSVVEVDFKHLIVRPGNADSMLNESEKEYERLWQNYFKSVNIASRKNPKLHRQHMPLRYWKHLTEKW